MSSSDIEDFRLPDNVPDQLTQLLEKWKRIHRKKYPTCDDFDFDALVEFHRGLYLLDPVGTGNTFDPLFVRTGPNWKERVRPDIEGMSYSDVITSPNHCANEEDLSRSYSIRRAALLASQQRRLW